MGKLNIELFKKVRDRIAEIPESFEQSRWIMRRRSSPCGYAACLAGETIICNAPTVEEGLRELRRLNAADEDANSALVANTAGKLLGLKGSYYESGEHDIFVSTAQFWPEPFRSRFAEGDESGAAIAYLDHIIETGKVLE